MFIVVALSIDSHSIYVRSFELFSNKSVNLLDTYEYRNESIFMNSPRIASVEDNSYYAVTFSVDDESIGVISFTLDDIDEHTDLVLYSQYPKDITDYDNIIVTNHDIKHATSIKDAFVIAYSVDSYVCVGVLKRNIDITGTHCILTNHEYGLLPNQVALTNIDTNITDSFVITYIDRNTQTSFNHTYIQAFSIKAVNESYATIFDISTAFPVSDTTNDHPLPNHNAICVAIQNDINSNYTNLLVSWFEQAGTGEITTIESEEQYKLYNLYTQYIKIRYPVTTTTLSTTIASDTDESIALGNLNGLLSNQVLIQVIYYGLLGFIVITIIAYIQNWQPFWFKFCCIMTDDARTTALLFYALQFWDFMSDINFVYALGTNPAYGINSTIFATSLIFVVFPWICNVLFLIFYRYFKWTKHTILNTWIRSYASILIILVMLSGGVNASVNLCNSHLFGLRIFSMELPRYEYLKMSLYPTFIQTVFENLPQIIVQLYFILVLQTNNGNGTIFAAIFALISSCLSLLITIFVSLLQCSDPFIDKRFTLTVKLDPNENIKRVRHRIGLRKHIASSIALALEIDDRVIQVESITLGYQKLNMIISITDNEFNDKNYRNGRSVSIFNQIGNNTKSAENILKDKNLTKLLVKILNSKRNGRFAVCLKNVLKLQYSPSVSNVEFDKDKMPDLNDIINDVKKNVKSKMGNYGNEVVVITLNNNDKLKYQNMMKLRGSYDTNKNTGNTGTAVVELEQMMHNHMQVKSNSSNIISPGNDSDDEYEGKDLFADDNETARIVKPLNETENKTKGEDEDNVYVVELYEEEQRMKSQMKSSVNNNDSDRFGEALAGNVNNEQNELNDIFDDMNGNNKGNNTSNNDNNNLTVNDLNTILIDDGESGDDMNTDDNQEYITPMGPDINNDNNDGNILNDNNENNDDILPNKKQTDMGHEYKVDAVKKMSYYLDDNNNNDNNNDK